MNYFELINACLLELGYKKIVSFSDAVKHDHERIKSALNRVNGEICRSFNWPFLLKTTEISVNASCNEITSPINGRIDSVLSGNEFLKYVPDYKRFLSGNAGKNEFTLFQDKLIFSPSDENKIIKITYYTSDCAIDNCGVEKYFLEYETDKSLIPEHFDNILLVYGACMRMKTNLEHPKARYWFAMYNDTLANLRSNYVKSTFDYPKIRLLRS